MQVENRWQRRVIKSGRAGHAAAPLRLHGYKNLDARQVFLQHLQVGIQVVIGQPQAFKIVGVARFGKAAGDIR